MGTKIPKIKSRKVEKPATETKPKKTANLIRSEFPIVGIGASAGGLEALDMFFSNTPENCGLAFVVIQHLDPTHVGIMPELLQRITNMKVFQASDRLKIKANCVYVIPPNNSMSILNGALYLFEPLEMRGQRLPINVFFRSLADDRQEKSIGIILSGMGSDGSIGVKAIKEKGGIVLVQDTKTAKFDGMPRSAIQSVVADIIAPASELPAKLISILKHAPVVLPHSHAEDTNSSNIEKIIILLREQTGHDFSLYKKNTLFRRIERRKGVHQIDRIKNYVRFLQENPQEIEILFKELLIGVTSFFRDLPLWEKLKNEILPEMLQVLPKGYILRAWVPACSTGEEAYSLAIVFKEVMAEFKVHNSFSLQIFATDLDSDAIEKARRGYFSSSVLTEVSPERISRFFTPEADGYKINNAIREMVIFAPQNVIKDPPFTKLDILTCRNMLIYMEAELQNKIMSLFNYSLNTGGIMILGSAETLGGNTDGFKLLDNKLKIYKRVATVPLKELFNFPSSFNSKISMKNEDMVPPKGIANFQSLVDQIVIQQYSPASVLVNSKGDIIYITGSTGKYLEPAAGKANWNIHFMARRGLRELLPIAFRKVLKNYNRIVLNNVKIENIEGNKILNVSIQQIEKPDALKGMVLFVFNEVLVKAEKELSTVKNESATSTLLQKELEIELQRNYEDMQSAHEEMQTAQEELKSTNEELQSTNEELQSTNEELTTSKEEMQSLNEELQTVNIELQSKVSDYIRANDDMKNLLNSTEIATLFLDKDLNIRRFTDPVTKLFKLRKSDLGRPLSDLVNDLIYPELGENASHVLTTLLSLEKDVTTTDNRWFTVRIMPYRTIEDRIDGLVITFFDITIAKRLEFELKKNNQSLRNSE